MIFSLSKVMQLKFGSQVCTEIDNRIGTEKRVETIQITECHNN